MACVIDKARARFLDCVRFGVRDARGPVGPWGATTLLLLAAGLAGCSSPRGPGAVEDSLTSGRITIVCAPEALDLVARERDIFRSLYADATIELRPGGARDAVSALFGARCDVAVITRELTPEERSAAVKGGLELEGYRFAKDALVAIVHPANPVRNMSVPELRAIYSGATRTWSALAGTGGQVHPVVQPVESDVTAYFIEQVMQGEALQARAFTAPSDSAVVARVAADPAAVGYVTLAWAGRGARVLHLAPLTGLPYVKPDPESVYQGRYPMTRTYNYYIRTDGRPLAGGFSTFITSRDGQRIVNEAGLVPTSVPVRFVRRSPMLQSH
jgi:phosphate transport system substrate-binding protein